MSRPPEEERVAQLLASLAASTSEAPPADTAYWQARVRLVLEEERRRRASVLRPLRMLHVAIGIGALATAAVAVPLSPVIGFYAAPLVFAAVALGAQFLSETMTGRLR